MKGIVAVALVLMACGFSAAGSLGTDNGRYVFGQVSDFRKDQFLLDTETGALFKLYIDEEKGEFVMMEVPIIR